jgi:hypothetical protein
MPKLVKCIGITFLVNPKAKRNENKKNARKNDIMEIMPEINNLSYIRVYHCMCFFTLKKKIGILLNFFLAHIIEFFTIILWRNLALRHKNNLKKFFLRVVMGIVFWGQSVCVCVCTTQNALKIYIHIYMDMLKIMWQKRGRKVCHLGSSSYSAGDPVLGIFFLVFFGLLFGEGEKKKIEKKSTWHSDRFKGSDSTSSHSAFCIYRVFPSQ